MLLFRSEDILLVTGDFILERTSTDTVTFRHPYLILLFEMN